MNERGADALFRVPPALAGKFLINTFMLKAGILGLPNVGKSTLFNAITRTHKAEAANYPFCTIEPNVAAVAVPDERLKALVPIAHNQNVIPTMIECVDIAGLVRGASKGEGLGNKFLSHVREVDALIHVVRCFEDADITHVTGSIDPVRDIEIVSTELVISDLEAVQKRKEKVAKDAKRKDKVAVAEFELLSRLEPHLNAGKPANTLPLTDEEKAVMKGFFLLSDKPVIYVANVKDTDLAGAETNPQVCKVRDYARTQHACETVAVSAQLESDLADLTPAEGMEFLKELGVKESGVDQLIRSVYKLLGLRTFFTFNEKEIRAWTIHAGNTAVQAAGTIHTDFARGFIRAEAIPWDALVKCGSVGVAREKGAIRTEGKEYVVHDGEVLHFKFNV
jgi:GTP-binding protein YchF